MKISNKAIDSKKYFSKTLYYDRARDGMFDLIHSMKMDQKINTILLPAYIGWSPKEGSGIFDPISNIENLEVQYYKMDSELNIDTLDLTAKIARLNDKKFVVLLVNYFGFCDPKLVELIEFIKSKSGWVISDNAHGFFTYFNVPDYSDATFFSLHKMFPFGNGGSLIINNPELYELELNGNSEFVNNPWNYKIHSISQVRVFNYNELHKNIIANGDEYITPLKRQIPSGNVPQSFPIIIKKGNRDKIYQLLNENGFGVVSLYHTLINPLRSAEFSASLKLSQSILNLPVHQDVDIKQYPELVRLTNLFCEQTSQA